MCTSVSIYLCVTTFLRVLQTSNILFIFSYAVAEMTAVETHNSTTNILTQGFQQPWGLGVYIPEFANDNFSFGVFPNPSAGNFSLIADAKINASGTVKIVDVTGRLILFNEFDFEKGENKINIDLSHEAAGLYFLQMAVKNNLHVKNLTVNKKIQLIK